jgi:hypothetical protein
VHGQAVFSEFTAGFLDYFSQKLLNSLTYQGPAGAVPKKTRHPGRAHGPKITPGQAQKTPAFQGVPRPGWFKEKDGKISKEKS